MTSRKARCAVVGLGIQGVQYSRVYQACGRSDLALVCDVDEDRARATAGAMGCAWTTRYEEVAASDVDIVTVATPDFAHTPLLLAMASHGKHIVAEKPLCMNVGEARQIVDAVTSSGVQFMINLPRRFTPEYLAVKKAVAAGKIGEPVMGYVRLSDRRSVPTQMLTWAGRTGPHWFLFAHSIDHIRWVLGEEAREVYAVGRRGIVQGLNTWDAIQALVKFDRAWVTFETSWSLPMGWPGLIDRFLTLEGTEGRIIVDGTSQALAVSLTGSTFAFADAPGEIGGRPVGPMVSALHHFVDCVLDGKPHEGPTAADGLAVVAAIAAIERSLEAGKPVAVSGT